ncbi:MAG TPA: hypothetical protein EYG71_01760 [Leucothrix sp.]|nr:hypothetical protein [Leucothrix sp.]
MRSKVKIYPALKLSAFILTLPSILSACSTTAVTKKPTTKELFLVSHPPQKTLKKINSLLPHAMQWYEDVSKSLHAKGRKLTKAETQQAKRLGVKNPDLIRVVILEQFPEPNKNTTINHFEGARAMGNIIMIKPRHKNDSLILCHELVHVAQKDRLGLKQFLRQYAIEHEVLGYSKSLLENEAYALQQTIE